MKEIQGDIWDYHRQGHWIVITTNGTVKTNGEAVMGRGVALQAAKVFPVLQGSLGVHLVLLGNNIHCFRRFHLITFPVKHNWREKANVELIEKSLSQLVGLVSIGRLDYYQSDFLADINVPVYMVRPGCGNGQLAWEDVKPILEKYLDDRFVVVQR